jgi:hypothetical protein
MLIMIYSLVWILVTVATAGILFALGGISETILVIFGFLITTLFLVGFVSVLPWWRDRRSSHDR